VATKVQSRPIDIDSADKGTFPESGVASQARTRGLYSLCSPYVWREVGQYLADLLLRNVTVPEFLSGISVGLFHQIQKSCGKLESQQGSQDDNIIIFSGYNHTFLPVQAAECDDRGPDFRFNVSSILFVQLRAAARSLADDTQGARIVSLVGQLETYKGTPRFLKAYQDFVASIAGHLDAFGSYLPELTKMLSEK